jgi:hypothetical protein
MHNIFQPVANLLKRVHAKINTVEVKIVEVIARTRTWLVNCWKGLAEEAKPLFRGKFALGSIGLFLGLYTWTYALNLYPAAMVILGGHLKTGHMWSLQNRPMGLV